MFRIFQIPFKSRISVELYIKAEPIPHFILLQIKDTFVDKKIL